MSVYPNEARYKRVENFNDKVMSRQTTKISPFNGSQFGPKNIDRILFNVPSESNKSIDMDTLMIHFDAYIEVGAVFAETDTYFLNSIESVISALRIRKGTSFLLEDIRNYNYLDSMFMNYVNKNYNDSFGSACMGIGSSLDRLALHPVSAGTTSKTRSYVVPLRLSGISNYSGLIDSALIDPVSCFQIELELAQSSDALVSYNISAVGTIGTANANAYYVLQNCYMTYDTVTMVPEYYQSIQQTISRGIPLQIPYKTFRSQIYSLPSGTPSIVYNINDSVKSLNAIFISFFKTEEQGKFNVAGKDRKHIPPIKTCQLQLGSQYYPLQPLNCQTGAPQAFIELQKALGLGFLRSENSGPFSFKGSEFGVCSIQNTFNLLANFVGVAQQQNGLDTSAVFPDGSKFNDANYTRAVGNTGNFASTDIGKRYMREVACSNPTEFMLGFNLKKVLDVSEGEIVGTDVQNGGSGLMSLRFDFETNTTTNYNVIVVALYDAVLEIQSNQQAFRIE